MTQAETPFTELKKEMTLNISWKDFFLDELLDHMPPGCHFSIHKWQEGLEDHDDFLLTWRGQEIGMICFHKASVEFKAYNEPDKNWYAEFNNPECTPETLSKVITEVINEKRGEYFKKE